MVTFDEKTHTYTCTETGKRFVSATTLLGKYKPVFDKEKAAKRVSAREGIPYQLVLDTWEQQKQIACDRGTPIHKAMENFILHKQVDQDYSRSMFVTFKDIISSFKPLKLHSEKLLFLKEFELAGTSDIIIDHDNKFFSVLDFKTNKKIRTCSAYNEFLLEPVEHLTNCEYSIYTLQLSLYAYMYEKMTGLKCREIAILFLEGEEWKKISSVYLKNDIINLLEYRKDDINKNK